MILVILQQEESRRHVLRRPPRERDQDGQGDGPRGGRAQHRHHRLLLPEGWFVGRIFLKRIFLKKIFLKSLSERITHNIVYKGQREICVH